jgi:hypothetical protein
LIKLKSLIIVVRKIKKSRLLWWQAADFGKVIPG